MFVVTSEVVVSIHIYLYTIHSYHRGPACNISVSLTVPCSCVSLTVCLDINKVPEKCLDIN